MKKRLDQKGFTLVEVVAAIGVFAFGILALYRLQTSAVHGNFFANDLTQATVLAENRLDELMALDYRGPGYTAANVLLLERSGTTAGATGLNDTTGDARDCTEAGFVCTADHCPLGPTNGKFCLYWNIADGENLADSKTIRVIVTWRDEKGTLHRTALTSIKVEGV